MNKTRSSGKHEVFNIPELDKEAETYIPNYVLWTDDAERIVWIYYPKIGARGVQKYLAKHYPPERTLSAIQNKYSELKLRGGV